LVYKIKILRPAQKQLMALPRPAQIEIVQAIDRLADKPRPSGCKKLKGTELWRIRIGRFRVIYYIIDKELQIVILKASARQEDTYRNL
jgi:mRNA interferase RelE/StbE